MNNKHDLVMAICKTCDTDHSDSNGKCPGLFVKPKWNGEGLPPVYGECMALFDTNDDEWLRAKIIAHDEGIVIGRWLDGVKEGLLFEYRYKPSDYRPIRTEAERRREISIKEMIRAAETDTEKPFIDAIFDAIAAGKIPGVKLEE